MGISDLTPGSGSPAQELIPRLSTKGSSPDTHQFPLITVVVPTWNSQNDIIDFLESVSRQTYPKGSVEIVVIDNGSTDRSADVVSDWFGTQQSSGWHRLHLIALPTNQGIAQAYNLGYKKCSPASHAVLRGEADVLLEPEVIERLYVALQGDQTIGVAGARGLLYGTMPLQLDHAAGYMNWWNGRLHRVDPPHLVDCDSVLGPTFLTRRSCIDEMQFFFPADRFLASELEFCTRVKRGGYRVVCEPAAVVYHKGARSTRHLDVGKFGYIEQRETVLFHLKYNPFPQKLFCLIWTAAYAVKQACRGHILLLLGLRDGFRWWRTERPTGLPRAQPGSSLSEWLVKS